MRFSVGVNYWPGRTAAAMWHDFDAGEIGEDFARIAGLGLDSVRIFVRWDEFAPQAHAFDRHMLDRFETIVARAAQAGLRLMPALFCGQMDSVNYVPDWALDRRRSAGVSRTICAGRVVPYAVANIYAQPLLDAQLAFARAIGERVRDHPAIVAWDIGHAFTELCEPSGAKVSSGDHSTQPVSEYDVAQWSKSLATALREASGQPTTAGTHSADLTADRNIRMGSLCEPFAFASMQAQNVDLAFARNRLDAEAVPFLAMLTAAFSFKRVLVTGFGNPTCPAGKFSAFEHFATPGEPPRVSISPDDTAFATYPCLTDDENAAWCAAVLERLHADGRLGAYWWCWSDYAAEQHAGPPFDEVPHARSGGIVRVDGSLKPVAETLSIFARQAREVVKARDMPMIASAYYYRTLPTSTATLYDAFLGAMTERRAGKPSL